MLSQTRINAAPPLSYVAVAATVLTGCDPAAAAFCHQRGGLQHDILPCIVIFIDAVLFKRGDSRAMDLERVRVFPGMPCDRKI